MSKIAKLAEKLNEVVAQQDEAATKMHAARRQLADNRARAAEPDLDLEERTRLLAEQPALLQIVKINEAETLKYRDHVIPAARRELNEAVEESRQLREILQRCRADLTERGPFAYDRRKLQLAMDGVDARERAQRQKAIQLRDRLQFLTGEVVETL